MTTTRSERGQALVFTVLAMTVMLGMAAFVLDVGSWFRADRKLQAAADAAALAAAQALPEDPGYAAALATQYAQENAEAAPDEITFTTKLKSNDTVTVALKRNAPGFFSKVLGIDSAEIHARAAARAANVNEAKWAAPIVVHWRHPKLQCKPLPCFGEATTLELRHLHQAGSGDAAGSFGFLNLDLNDNGGVGSSRLSKWILTGFDQYMPLGGYRAATGARFNSEVKTALADRYGTEMLFPIYRTISGSGNNAQYQIIGWVGFVPTDCKCSGDKGTLFGSFKRVIWEGIQSKAASQEDYGVRSIALVE